MDKLNKNNEEIMNMDEPVVLPYTGLEVNPNKVVKPIFIIPKADDSYAPMQFDSEPYSDSTKEQFDLYIKMNKQFNGNMDATKTNNFYMLAQQFVNVLDTNIHIILFSNTFNTLKMYLNPGKNIYNRDLFYNDHYKDMDNLVSYTLQLASSFENCADKATNFGKYIAETKAYVAKLLTNWLYQYVNTIIYDGTLNVNRLYEDLRRGIGINDGNESSRYTVIATMILEMVNYDLSVISDMVELGIVNYLYNILDYLATVEAK